MGLGLLSLSLPPTATFLTLLSSMESRTGLTSRTKSHCDDCTFGMIVGRTVASSPPTPGILNLTGQNAKISRQKHVSAAIPTRTRKRCVSKMCASLCFRPSRPKNAVSAAIHTTKWKMQFPFYQLECARKGKPAHTQAGKRTLVLEHTHARAAHAHVCMHARCTRTHACTQLICQKVKILLL